MQFFFRYKEKDFETLSDALDAACEGLIYVSETDSPVVPFVGDVAGEVTAEIVLQQTGKPPDTPVEELDVTTFFERLTRDRDWYGDAERLRAKKFLELQSLLEEYLNDARVFRLGRIRIDIYVVGLDATGRLAGVTTFAVET
jgi:hypothetical protein